MGIRPGDATISPGGLWAVARLTLLEASRRKVFIILLLFMGAILSSMAFFPSVEPAGRLRLMEIWALRAISLFTALVALFITGFSLPGDFEQRRIYLLVTKPISKATIFLGKFLGLTILLAVFVAAMGLVTLLFIRTVQALSGPGFPKVQAFERHEAEAFGAIEPLPKEDPDDPARMILARSQGALQWEFRGLRREDFTSTIALETRLSIGSPDDKFRSSGTVTLDATTPADKSFHAEEFINTNEDREWSIPAGLIGPDGVLKIRLQCGDSDGFLSGGPSSAAIFLKPVWFEPVFIRGLLLLFFQSVTVLSVTLMASAILSAPLSILLGILLYIVGSSHGYVREGTRDIDRSLAELSAGKKHVQTPAEIPSWFLRFSSTVSNAVLFLVPDYEHFDYGKWLLKDRAVTGRDLGAAALRALPVVLITGILGMAVMIFKDFG
jgi:hypothetical protein